MAIQLLGCIADDYTGATDLASMLVRAGLRVIQLFGVDGGTEELQFLFREERDRADAVVIALKTRSIPPADAVRQSLEALRCLKAMGADRYYFKYCSTFDSTSTGNIGPVAEALAHALDVRDVWYCPSFPENGRTVYCGHLFVNGVPLDESGMKDHPLNPMTDSNLVRVLQAQCQRRVGLLRWADTQVENPQEHPQADAVHWIVDALTKDDMQRLGRLAKDMVFVTGGSAMGGAWGKALFEQYNRERQASENVHTSSNFEGALFTIILAGSCSTATRNQIDAFEEIGPVCHLNVLEAAKSPASFESVAMEVTDWCLQQSSHFGAALVESGRDASVVSEVSRQLGRQPAAELTESLFASVAKSLVGHGLTRLIVAGGETSGAVINALQVRVVRVEQEIAPGVPWVRTLGSTPLLLALKSGNFGDRTFFQQAIDCISKSSFDSVPSQ